MNKCSLRILKTICIIHSCRPLRKTLIVPKESLPGRDSEKEAGRGVGTAGFHYRLKTPLAQNSLNHSVVDFCPGSATTQYMLGLETSEANINHGKAVFGLEQYIFYSL